MMTTKKTIEYLQTGRVTPEGMTGEGMGNGVEAAALPTPSLHRRVQKSGDMGIIGRDGWEFRMRGEGWIHPRVRGGGRHPSIVGRPHTGSWRTGPQTPYATTPRGGTLGKFWSPEMMGADDGRAPLRRDATNLNPPPCTPSPLGGKPKKNWAVAGTCISPGRGTP